MIRLDKDLYNNHNIELYRLYKWNGIKILKEDYVETVDINETSDVKLCEEFGIKYIFGTTNNARDNHWRGYKIEDCLPYDDNTDLMKLYEQYKEYNHTGRLPE